MARGNSGRYDDIVTSASSADEVVGSCEPLISFRFGMIIAAATFNNLTLGLILPVLPLFVKDDLGGNALAIGLAVGAFSLASAVAQVVTARLGFHHRRRALCVASALTIAIGVATYSAAPTVLWFLMLRMVTGFGQAGVYQSTAVAIQDLAPENRRAEAFSYYSLSIFVGLAIGPVIGEAVMRKWGYDTVWFVGAAISLMCAVLALQVPDAKPRSTSDHNAVRRLIHPAGVAPGLLLILVLFGYLAFQTFVPLHAENLGLRGAGSALALFSVILLALRVLCAKVPDRLGAGRSARLAMSGIAAGLLVISTVQLPAGLYAGTLLLACGWSFSYPALMAMSVQGVPAHERTSAMATFIIAWDVGATAIAPILSLVVLIGGVVAAFVLGAAICLAGLALVRPLESLGRR